MLKSGVGDPERSFKNENRINRLRVTVVDV
jgi:hypothetical protein